VPAQYLPTATEAVEPSLERLSTGVGEELQEETVEVREGFRE
jgi:hypothetical protein